MRVEASTELFGLLEKFGLRITCMVLAGFWAFLFFIGFCYLANQWSKAEEPPADAGVGNVKAAIYFSLFSACAWVNLGYKLFHVTFLHP